MKDAELARIKNKVLSIDPSKYWGDDFDVRYYAITRLEGIHGKLILDAGGGIGIVSSELSEKNSCINLDLNFSNLVTCKTKTDKNIEDINGVMNFLPFRDSTFDHIVCCHVLDSGKAIDIQNNKEISDGKTKRYPTADAILQEFKRTLKQGGKITLTIPNNQFYQKMAFEYDEIKDTLSRIFPDHLLYFFNTFPKMGNSRKLNLANTIPKLSSKFLGQRHTLEKLAQKESGNACYSVSFYVEAIKN